MVWIVAFASAKSQSLPAVRWKNIDHRDGIPEIFIPNEVMQDKLGRLWIAHEQGLIRYDGYKVDHFLSRQENSELHFTAVYGIHEDPEGQLWVTIRGKGLAIIDPVTDKIHRLYSNEGGTDLSNIKLWDFYPEKGKLWIASEGGLVAKNDLDTLFELYKVKFEDVPEKRLAFYNIMRDLQAHPADTNKLLIGAGGLLEFDKTAKTFRPIPMPFNAAVEVGLLQSEYLIMDIEVPDSNTVWCATWAGGTMSYNLNSGQWHRIRNPLHHDHLWQDVGFHLQKKSENEAWIASRDGFGCINLNTSTYQYYKHSPSDIYSILPGPAHKFIFTHDSLLVVAGERGVSISATYPGYKQERTKKFPFLTELRINDKLWQGDTSVIYLKTLSLKENETSVSFSAGLPLYHDQVKVKYRFRLSGYDRNWREDGTRQISYSNLKPGKYQLYYQASLNGINWTDGITAPRIHIKGVFWKHPLFIASGALLLTGVGFGLFRVRIHQIRKEEALTSAFNKRLAIVEMSALRAQMNPHFLFNSLNAINTYILKEKTKEASTYLTKFSQLMRSVLQNSKSALVPWSEELKALRLYIELEAVRFHGEFRYTIDVAPDIDLEGLWVPPLLIQPYVENAIRHGLLEKEDGAGVLTIKILSGTTNTLEVHVEDNGIGRKQAEEKKRIGDRNRSYGMEITNDRIKLIEETLGIKASIFIHDRYTPEGKATGTTVILIMPRIRSGELNGKKQKT